MTQRNVSRHTPAHVGSVNLFSHLLYYDVINCLPVTYHCTLSRIIMQILLLILRYSELVHANNRI